MLFWLLGSSSAWRVWLEDPERTWDMGRKLLEPSSSHHGVAGGLPSGPRHRCLVFLDQNAVEEGASLELSSARSPSQVFALSRLDSTACVRPPLLHTLAQRQGWTLNS